MMKKYLLYIFLFTAALSSCKKNTTEPIIGDVDERLSSTLTAYQTQLTGAQFGWKGYLLTDSKLVATFLFTFTDKNRTTMSADYSVPVKESSYRLKALQRPTLLFDTYSTLHLINDPTSSVFGGDTGAGYYTDFEFAFLSATTDTIKLEGTFNKSKLVLVRSTSAADNAGAFTAPDVVGASMNASLSKLRTYFKRTTIGGQACDMKINVNYREITFSYLDGTTPKTAVSSYFVAGSKLVLFTPIKIGTTTVTELAGVTYDAATGFVKASLPGATIEIKEAIAPVFYDKTAATAFITSPTKGSWSEAYEGYTVDGVADAYGISIAPGADFDFFPKLIPARFALFTAAGYNPYEANMTTVVNANGLLVNTLTTMKGTAVTAANIAQKPLIDKTTAAFTKAGGHYVFRFEDGTFDVVAASDARSWIHFE